MPESDAPPNLTRPRDQLPENKEPSGDQPEKTKVAVALSYDSAKDPAPRITATGRGSLAEQILTIAFASGVRVREDSDLAELLATVEVDSLIPLEAFAAVAEILAYLYRYNGTTGRAGTAS